MSNDWWTSSSSQTHSQSQQSSFNSFHTPQRPSYNTHNSIGSNRQSRFNSTNVGDELDSEDLKMVDQIKFLPSFANSPAGKLALGTSPQNSMSNNSTSGFGGFGTSAGAGGGGSGAGGMSSPNEGRRSPGVSTNMRDRAERDSPRHHRRSLLHQNSQLGSSAFGGGGGMMIDEDMPPTASLRDSTSGNANNYQSNDEVSQPVELPTPQTLLPSSSTTTLHIFGPPPEILSNLREYLAQFGEIIEYKPGPEGSNWFIVTYSNSISASYALRRHGDILQGRYMIGFKVANENSINGFTHLPNAQQNQQIQQRGGNGSGIGTPIKVQDKSIVKPKQNQQSQQAQKPSIANNDYSWDDHDDNSKSNGWSGWVSERLFGR